MSKSIDEKNYHFVKVPFRVVAVVTVCFPLFSFFFCIGWSLLFNFHESTTTHCRVMNYLPSISAAIGGYTPQLYIWRIGIGLHAAPRYAVAVMYYYHYIRIMMDQNFWRRVACILSALHVIENSALVGLTYISSSDNYPIHEKFFVTFIFSSLTYMLLSCTIPYVASRKPLDVEDRKLLKLKSCLATIAFAASLAAAYFFLRHNKFCEAGMYTLFALSEYIIVLTNIAFHMTAYWDFYDEHLTIGSFEKTSRIWLYP